MLLGIYDDLLMAGGAAQAGGYRLRITGYPLNPQSQPQVVLTRDLSNWTVGVIPWVGFVASVAQGNELLLATGNAPDGAHPNGVNRMALSKDYGKTWSEVTMPANGLDVSFSLCMLAFGRGLFVCNANQLNYQPGLTGLSTSPDGIVWTARQNPWVGPATVGFVNGMFVMSGYDAVNITPAYAISVDGISWAKRPNVWGTMQASATGLSYQNGLWILTRAGTDSAAFAWSTDLANWTLGALPCAGSGVFYADQIVYFKGRYYGFAHSMSGGPPNAYSTTGTVSVSSDLKNWSVLTTGLPSGLAGAADLGDGRLVVTVATGVPLITYSAAGLSYSSPGPVTSYYVTSDMQNFSQLSQPGAFYDAGASAL